MAVVVVAVVAVAVIAVVVVVVVVAMIISCSSSSSSGSSSSSSRRRCKEVAAAVETKIAIEVTVFRRSASSSCGTPCLFLCILVFRRFIGVLMYQNTMAAVVCVCVCVCCVAVVFFEHANRVNMNRVTRLAGENVELPEGATQCANCAICS